MKKFLIILVLVGLAFGQSKQLSKSKMLGNASASPSAGSANAFATFVSTEPSVVYSNGFDVAQTHTTTATTTSGIVPLSGTSTYADALDTSVKVNGPGALRFNIPASCAADCSGFFKSDFSATPFASQYASGDEFYFSYAFRITPAMLSNTPRNAQGWKQSIVGIGDYNTGGVDYVSNSCTTPELTINKYDNTAPFPKLYHSCGLKDNQYQAIFPSFSGGTNFELQPGYQTGSTSCYYLDLPSYTGCLQYTANTWMQFIGHVKPCQNYVNNSKNYYHCTQVDIWAGPLGSPLPLVVSHPYYDVNQHTNTGDWDAQAVPPGLTIGKYGKIWLGNYDTGRCADVVQASTLARDAAGIVTATTTTVPTWVSQNGDCVLASDAITFAGFSDATFNVSGTAIAQDSTTVIRVQTAVTGQAATITTQTGTVTDTTAPATASAMTWYDNLLVTTRRPPDWQATTPCTPDNLSVTNSGTDDTVTWRDNSDVFSCPPRTGWTLQQTTGDIFKDAYANLATFSDISQSGLSCVGAPSICTIVVSGAGTAKHTYRVRATNGSGNSGWSNSATNTPGFPSDILVTSNSPTSATVTWNQNGPAAATFTVERCDDTVGNCGNPSGAGSYSVKTTSAGCCTYTDTSVSAGGTYSFRVKAVNAAGSLIDWGDFYYGGTSYGGGTTDSEITMPIMARNTVLSLGSGSSLTQPPSGTYVTSSLCTDLPYPLQGTSNHCPESQVRPWVSGVYRTINDMMTLRGGGHVDGGSSEFLDVLLTSSGGAFHGTPSQLLAPITTGLCTSAAFADFAVPGTGSCPSTYANCVPAGPNYDNCTENAKHTYDQVTYIPDGEINALGVTGDTRLSLGGQPPNDNGLGANNASVGGCGASIDAWLHPFKTSDTLYPKERALHASTDAWTCDTTLPTSGGMTVLKWDTTSHHAFFFRVAGSSTAAAFFEWDLTANLSCGKHICQRSTFTLAGDVVQTAAGAIDTHNGVMLIFLTASELSNPHNHYIWACKTSSPWTCTDVSAAFSSCSLTTNNSGVGFSWYYPGVVWNPDKNVVAFWPDFGNHLWELSSSNSYSTATCSDITLGGDTITNVTYGNAFGTNGTMGRLGYSTNKHLYMLINDSIQPTWLMCTKSGGCGP